MAIDRVTMGLKGTSADLSSSIVLNPNTTVATGNLIVVGVIEYDNDGADTFVVSDISKSAGTCTVGSWVLDKTIILTSPRVLVGIYSCLVTGNGTLTGITVTAQGSQAGGDYWDIGCQIYSGSYDADRLIDSDANQGSGTAADSNEATSPGAAIFFGAVGIDQGSDLAITRDGAYSLVYEQTDGSSHLCGSFIDKITTGGNTDSASWTITSTAWAAAVAVYQEVGGATAVTPNNATHSQAAGSDTFAQNHLLGTIICSHSHVASQATFSLAQVIAANNSSHAHTGGGAVFTQVHQLIATNCLSDHSAGMAGFLLPSTVSWPLKSSGNNRYLMDQNNVPFLIVGDSPQGMLADLSLSEMGTYMTDRQSRGINLLQVHLIAGPTFGGRTDFSTYDSITPFTTTGDISTPRESYFARVDSMLDLAFDHGMTIVLDAAETLDALDLWKNNGTTKCRAFGQYLGNRYKDFTNLIWCFGNDFQTWETSGDNAVVLAVCDGIKDNDSNHLHTVWLEFFLSASRDSTDWDSRIDLDFGYSYYPTYDICLDEYAKNPAKPVHLGESNYEGESIKGYTTTAFVIRKQNYWATLSGGCGVVYCNGPDTYKFNSGWASRLSTTGVNELAYFKTLFCSRPWWTLIPDNAHAVLTSGYGTYTDGETGSINTNDYAAAALASDSSTLIAYLPTSRQITIDMTKMSGSQSVAYWFNPTTGAVTTIGTYDNTGTRNFTPSSGDWVFVLDDISIGYPEPGASLWEGVLLDQSSFRWRNDNGDEASATWKASQDADISFQKGQNVRLRMMLDSSGDVAAGQYQLECRKVGDSTWSKVN